MTAFLFFIFYPENLQSIQHFLQSIFPVGTLAVDFAVRAARDPLRLFAQKSSFVSEDRPIRDKNRTKSNRTLLHYLNTKMFRTNFYQNFAKL